MNNFHSLITYPHSALCRKLYFEYAWCDLIPNGKPLSHHEKNRATAICRLSFFQGPPSSREFFWWTQRKTSLQGVDFPRVALFFGKNLSSLCLKNLLHLYWHCDTCFLSIVLDLGKPLAWNVIRAYVHIPLIISSISHGNLFISPDKCFW